MNNFNQNLINELMNDGIVTIDNYFSKEDIKKLNLVFGSLKDDMIKYQSSLNDIKSLSNQVFNFINEKEIQSLLKNILQVNHIVQLCIFLNIKLKSVVMKFPR